MTYRVNALMHELAFVTDLAAENKFSDGDMEMLDTARILLGWIADGTICKDFKGSDAWGKAGLEANDRRFAA